MRTLWHTLTLPLGLALFACGDDGDDGSQASPSAGEVCATICGKGMSCDWYENGQDVKECQSTCQADLAAFEAHGADCVYTAAEAKSCKTSMDALSCDDAWQQVSSGTPAGCIRTCAPDR